MGLEILSPSTAEFSVITANPRTANPGSPENPNDGIQNLIARANPKALVSGKLTLAVRMRPIPEPSGVTKYTVIALDNWSSMGPYSLGF